jgi:hypothetical protein
MEVEFLLGATKVVFFEHKLPTKGKVIVLNVHEDEVTSIETLFAHSALEPFDFFYLKHQGTRRIQFELDQEFFSVDPNRIFTKKGRKMTLKDGGNYSKKASKEVKKFAKEICKRLDGFSVVIALHNNSDVNYTIKSYLPSGEEAQNTKAIHINPTAIADDFIYTTERNFFEQFKALDINVILQDNKRYVNDGSLSVYCGKRGIPYINIETEIGHFEAQMTLLSATFKIVQEKS